MASDSPYGRRQFLRDSALSFGRTLHEYAKHRDASREDVKPGSSVPDRWVRPPGAVAESLFLERCTRCADCVEACPYGAVTVLPELGTPAVVPSEKACYLCDDFPCIHACETEALVPLPAPEQARMGLAVVSSRHCTAEQGCNACVSQCPVQALTMDFDALRVRVSEERCVGCGLCEQTCKTVNDKVAIKVFPL